MAKRTRLIASLFFCLLPSELLAIQVTVPYTERSTTLFASIILRCDYSTSASLQDVLVTWRYKTFCMDPVLQYYSAAYQAALSLGQNPTNDCQDSQRVVRTVIQKRGLSEPILGVDYQERKITIQNKADLVINEVMWWDNGMYFCSIDAPGDTIGDSDKEIRLIVYNWLTVLFIIIGAVLLIILLGVCCCQCCPQGCCCYVRCPCCPRTCCCPEKLVMQHRMMREAQKAMAPWLYGQPIYSPIDSNGSSQGNPLLYPGSVSEYPSKHNIPMGPMVIPSISSPPMVLPNGVQANGSMYESVQSSMHGNKPMLDFLENQVRGMDVGAPVFQPQYVAAPLQAVPPQQIAPSQLTVQMQPLTQSVPYAPGPPSMLSALDEMGVRGVERRVIQLPPIMGRAPNTSSRRVQSENRGALRFPSHSSSSSSRNSHHRDDSQRGPGSARRGILRSYSDESDWDDRYRHRGSKGHKGGAGGERSRPRARSKRELIEELQRANPRRGSWSSEEDSHRGAKRSRDRSWPEKPPSYSSIEVLPGHVKKTNDRNSDKSSRSGVSVVI
ncbi:immunoglobulin-like domain-containing receptor 1b [Hoplias malabaricus]|uniref:immunoglobulin-like domain-containing receptor 1b n=1 Tax=Hoplias malabaricus TaxID=27720 RepID=UPI0034632277